MASAAVEPPVMKQGTQGSGLGGFAPPPLNVEIDNDTKAMPPPLATSVSPRGAFTPQGALHFTGGIKSPAMTRPNQKG